MANLSIDFAGIRSPNPFWIASGPPSNTANQVHRALEAGWGGVVWKTIGQPIRNTSSRYSTIEIGKCGWPVLITSSCLATARPFSVQRAGWGDVIDQATRYPRRRTEPRPTKGFAPPLHHN